MSEVAIRPARDAESAFSARTMLLIAAAGIFCFAAMIVLAAFAPDLSSGRDGGSHALSTGATGFNGIVRLAEATGRKPRIGRSDFLLADTEGLAVLTPQAGTVDMSKATEQRGDKPTLVVMPKWTTIPDPAHPGWVRIVGLRARFDPESTLAPAWPVKISRSRGSQGQPLRFVPADAPRDLAIPAPRLLQTMQGANLVPILTDGDGRVVLARLGKTNSYMLSDPDLLANNGMADARRAEGALRMLDYLGGDRRRPILFDVTLNGLGVSPSPLKLALVPPFLAATLSLAAALLLIAVRAATRFGRPDPPERALAFGKRALVDNTAALVGKARREGGLGGRYAEMVRERAAALFAAPPRLTGPALDAYLDRIGGGRHFSELAAAAGEAHRPAEMLAAAQALNDWQGENHT
ncbi:MAG: hypothetical protein ACJ8DZ_11115 [Allosphingosinicella sp.]